MEENFIWEANELFIKRIGDNGIVLEFGQNGQEIGTIGVSDDTLHRFAQTMWDTSQALKNQ